LVEQRGDVSHMLLITHIDVPLPLTGRGADQGEGQPTVAS
jgi:hypothetical protein